MKMSIGIGLEMLVAENCKILPTVSLPLSKQVSEISWKVSPE